LLLLKRREHLSRRLLGDKLNRRSERVVIIAGGVHVSVVAQLLFELALPELQLLKRLLVLLELMTVLIG
jgi:hypothetical protein